MNPIPESELILNPDGSIYHLNLRPDDIGDIIITVGDPDRVDSVTKYFDQIHLSKQKREFKTVTGSLADKTITVISTGIGTDNIDIVLNELDALVNIDLQTRVIKTELKKLNIIRIGTSGVIVPDIPVDSFLISRYAIGLEGLLDNYNYESNLISHEKNYAVVSCSPTLYKHFNIDPFLSGITLTAAGFYGPQGRNIRLQARIEKSLVAFEDYSNNDFRVTNLEMETAGIYGLGALLGHECISLNALLANRKLGQFSSQAEKTTEKLIELALERISKL